MTSIPDMSSATDSEFIASTSLDSSDMSSRKRRFVQDTPNVSLASLDTVSDRRFVADRRPFFIQRSIVGCSSVQEPSCTIDAPTCDLCYQFTTSFLENQSRDFPGSKWVQWGSPEDTKPVELFRHHSNTRLLRESAQRGCQLCNVIIESPHFLDGCEMILTPTHTAEDSTVSIRYQVTPQFGLIPQREHRFAILPLKHMRPYLPLDVDRYEFVLAKDEEECRGFSGEFSRYPLHSPASDESLKQIVAWHKACLGHEKCTRVLQDPPERLLDVHLDGNNPGRVHLRSTRDIERNPDALCYAALSYKWGSEESLVTNEANIKAHSNGFSMKDLPQVIQDAIYVARRLGIRYLWTDRICICQDNPKEWTVEAAKMSSIYGGATITFSAMSASKATDSFLNDRSLNVRRVGNAQVSYGNVTEAAQLFIRRLPRSIRKAITECSLNDRAWPLQERILSPSVIHFCPDQMIWECNACHLVSETGEQEDSGEVVIRLSDVSGLWKQCISQDRWTCIVDTYSARELSNLEDRLRAVSGIATRIRGDDGREDRYIAGLWEKDLDIQLAWKYETQSFVCGQSARADRQIPTWSWAHWNRPACMTQQSDLTSALTERPVFVGDTVALAKIRLTGYLQQVGDTAFRRETYSVRYDKGKPIYIGLPGLRESSWFFDYEPIEPGPYFCLRILQEGYQDEVDLELAVFRKQIKYLILKPVSHADIISKALSTPVYRRVGLLELVNMPHVNIRKSCKDILFRNGKPLLTGGTKQTLCII